MINIAFAVVWIMVFVALGFFVVAAVRNVHQINVEKGVYTLGVIGDYCYPNQDINNLPSIAEAKCCSVNGTVRTTRQYNLPTSITGSNLGSLLPVLVDTVPVPINDVCAGFCNNYNNQTDRCDDGAGTRYDICSTILIPPVGCTSLSVPVAQLNGDTPYYAVQDYVAGSGECTELVSC